MSGRQWSFWHLHCPFVTLWRRILGQNLVFVKWGFPNWFLTSKTLSTHQGASIYTFGCTKKRVLVAPNNPLNFYQNFDQKCNSSVFGLLCSHFWTNMQVLYYFRKLRLSPLWWLSPIEWKINDQWEIKWVPENMYTFSIVGIIVNVYKFSGTHFKLLKIGYEIFLSSKVLLRPKNFFW